MLNIYQTKTEKLSGTGYVEIYKRAHVIYKKICSKTKRKPYIRSKYFKKEKVFLDYFWQHLHQKSQFDRLRRIKYYACAIDLIANSHIAPTVVPNPNNKSETFYRFRGMTEQRELFIVQIKESKKSQNKHFISVFPG